MPVCKRTGCPYLLRSNKNNLFCCKMCMKGKGHGPACQKNRVGSRVVTVVQSVSIISWGDSVYGEYIVFNFKTDIVSTIVAMNYKVYQGSTVLLQGTLPYIFANSQIIFSSVSIIDKNVTLELSLKLPGGTVSNSKTSSLTNLNSSPYINCDYFKQGSSTTTTTTKAPTTKAPTTNGTVGTTTTTNATTTNGTVGPTTTTVASSSTTNATSNPTTTATLIQILRRNSDETSGSPTYTNTVAYPSGTKISVLLIGGGGGGSDLGGFGGTGSGISFTYVFTSGLAAGDLTIRNLNVPGNTSYYGYSNVLYTSASGASGPMGGGVSGAEVSITFVSGATTYSIVAGGGGGANANNGSAGALTASPSTLLTTGLTGFVIVKSGAGESGSATSQNGYIKAGGDLSGLGQDNSANLATRGSEGVPDDGTGVQGVSYGNPTNGNDGYWSLIIDPRP